MHRVPLPSFVARSAVACSLAGVLAALPAVPAQAQSAAAEAVHAQPQETQTGLASYYSRRFDGKTTAGGTTFSNDALLAAHATYPLGTLVRVTNVRNGAAVDVRIVDRGASRRSRREGVIIDVSQAAAERLKMKKAGRVRVRVEVLEWGKDHHKPLPHVAKREPGGQ